MPKYQNDTTEIDYQSAIDFCKKSGVVSPGRLQRHLGVGFNAAMRVVELMQDRGFCERPDFSGRRKIIEK